MKKLILNMLGLACYVAWQNAFLRFVFPSSASTAVSPLFAFVLSSGLLLVVFVTRYRKNSTAPLSRIWFVNLAIVGTLAGSVCGGLVARTLLPLEGVYVSAIVGGFSTALLAYAWAERVLELTEDKASIVVFGALALGSVVELFGMHVAALAIPWFFGFMGVLGCVFYLLGRDAQSAMRDPDDFLVYRPEQGRDYLLLAVGVIVLSAALGITSGSTASVCTEESMRVLNVDVTLCMLVAASLCLLASARLKHRFAWKRILWVLPSALTVIILMNLLLPAYMDWWLALSFVGWRLVRVLCFLFILEIARRRMVSLPLVFPVAWSVLFAGHALGILVGQAFLPHVVGTLLHIDDIFVIVCILTVCSSLFILGNPLVLAVASESKNPNAARTGFVVAESGNSAASKSVPVFEKASEQQEEASIVKDAECVEYAPFSEQEQPSADRIENRCMQLAKSHGLSDREREVMVLLAYGHTRASVAKKLFISENTVRAHAKNIYAKLYIHSRQQLIELVDEPSR